MFTNLVTNVFRWIAFFVLLPLILVISGLAIWWMGEDDNR